VAQDQQNEQQSEPQDQQAPNPQAENPQAQNPDQGADQAPDSNSDPSAGSGASADPGSAADGAPDPDQVGDSIATGIDSFADQIQTLVDDPSLANFINILGPILIDIGLAIAGLVVLVIIVSFVGRWTQRLARVGLRRLKLETTVVNFLSRCAKYAVWIIALPIALELFGVETTSLAAVIGAGGLAIGLALQGSLSNIAAGIMLLMLRPFKIDDWVEIDGEMGIVQDIGIFYTHIDTFLHELIILPNSQVLGAKIQHFTESPSRRIVIPVGVAYGTDLEKARDVLTEAAASVSKPQEKDLTHDVLLVGFGASSIDFEVRVWCPSREFIYVRTDAILAINKALADADINIPFPQRTLSFLEPLRLDRGGGGESGESDN